MSDTKLLQKVLDSVSSLKQEMREGFSKVYDRFDNVDKRMDKLVLQIASLEDDTPTIEEFDKLEKRVTKLERHAIPS